MWQYRQAFGPIAGGGRNLGSRLGLVLGESGFDVRFTYQMSQPQPQISFHPQKWWCCGSIARLLAPSQVVEAIWGRGWAFF